MSSFFAIRAHQTRCQSARLSALSEEKCDAPLQDNRNESASVASGHQLSHEILFVHATLFAIVLGLRASEHAAWLAPFTTEDSTHAINSPASSPPFSIGFSG
jgi:hypothetical protein